MSPTDVMVRMGELAVSNDPKQVLVSIGLGSCIGVALVDRGRKRAGLAHVMLPSSREGTGDAPAKFADVAVPALLDSVVQLGAAPTRLTAVLVGGAQMFSAGGGSGLDIGGRNERAVREALAAAGLKVHAAATQGTKGRTIRVHVGAGLVTVKEAGGAEVPLLEEAAA